MDEKRQQKNRLEFATAMVHVVYKNTTDACYLKSVADLVRVLEERKTESNWEVVCDIIQRGRENDAFATLPGFTRGVVRALNEKFKQRDFFHGMDVDIDIFVIQSMVDKLEEYFARLLSHDWTMDARQHVPRESIVQAMLEHDLNYIRVSHQLFESLQQTNQKPIASLPFF